MFGKDLVYVTSTNPQLRKTKSNDRFVIPVIIYPTRVKVNLSHVQILETADNHTYVALKMSTQLNCNQLCLNPFTHKGFLIDELNRLALDRVKSISALWALTRKG